jgi:site-specific recombinase XerD
MISAAKWENQKALVALLGFCGLRVAEALAVRPSHFDLNDMELVVRGKGDKTRRLPVSEEAWEFLLMPTTRAFCANDTEIVGIQDRAARALITRLGIKAGLSRRVSSHDLRATFATAVYDKTLDQRVVQELLGHSSGEQTELYIGVSRAKMKAAVEL